jgi:PRTRC genetic system protein A
MPYGEVEQSIEFAFDSVPKDLIQRFILDAQEAHPVEVAGWIVWNEQTEQLDYRRLRTIAGTNASLKAERPPLLPHEHLAVDLHSHGGDIPAFFSPEDDRDDRGEVKISVVIGNVNSDKISVEMRLCVLGLFIPL